MAVIIKEVQELENQKKTLNDLALSISQDITIPANDKKIKIADITDQMYYIDEEIKRLKNQPATIEYKESINPILLIIGIVGIFIIIKGKKK